MKIVRNTPEQLVLRSVPWIIAIMLSAMLLGVIAFGLNALFEGDLADTFWGLFAIPLFVSIFLVIFVRRDDLILDRNLNLLELRHSTFRGRTRVQHKLEHLHRAKLQSSRSNKGSTTYRIALVLDGGMDAGTHPVTPVYASGNGAKRGVEAINDWLAQYVDSHQSQA
ncbi:hypothetical protein BC777_3246 [Yoonia maricola]|uniref:PH (Pleckstrin Homology) domain-containing protein n=1 Tax=Yoonia maricola TaxID=420999 RepID=A0A2M8W2T9_9RHOB|nr:hypothetical protein [Yoonia maricola]PJI85246.1 hypothetical protein BC777_3246 [Yoonia maricola]